MELYRNVLYTLLFADGPCSGGTLCQIAGVSPKTLRKNIREINDLLASSGKARIISKVGVGYTLETNDESARAMLRRQIADSYLFSQLYASSQRNRLHFISRKLLVMEQVYLDELGEEIFYSDMTLQKDMKLVKKNLADFHIAISQNMADGCKIHGDEWDIRMALIYERAIYRKNAVLQQHPDNMFEQMFLGPRPMSEEYLLELLLEELDPALRFSMESLGFLVSWIQLSFSREAKRPLMAFLKTENDSTLQVRHRPRCTRIYERIREKYGLQGQPEDILGLCILVEAWHERKSDPQAPIRLFDEKELSSYLDRYFPGVFRYVEEDINQRLFYRMLENKLERISYCRRHRVHDNKDAAHQIQGTGLLCWQMCGCIAQYIRETSWITLTQEEIAHFYFVVVAYFRDHPLKSHPIQVLLVSALEQEHLVMMREDVLRNIHIPNMELTGVTYTESQKMDLTSYDFIFTDYPGDLARHAPGIPIVNVRFHNSYFSPSYYVGQYSLAEYLFRQLLRSELFYKGDFRSREDVFRLLRDKLSSVLDLPRQYFEEMEQQETILSFERSNRLAIIQPFSLLDVPDFACFLACRKPFRWYKREVQYVFVVSIFQKPEQYDRLIDQILSGLLHNASRLTFSWDDLTYETLLETILSNIS